MPKYEIAVDRNSPAYKRITGAGFYIKDIEVNYVPERYMYLVCERFVCVCGKEEMFVDYMDELELQARKVKDVAQIIEDTGQISVEHLREDGYSEEQISEIRKAYN